jgi:hypothetical protein
MAYRESADAARRRYGAQRERALALDERLPIGAFASLDAEVRDDLRRLRDLCDDLDDPPSDLSRGFELWAAYEEALRSAFDDAPPPLATEADQVVTALTNRHRLADVRPWRPSQHDAAAMVALVRAVDPQARIDWLGGAILTAKLQFEGVPAVVVVHPAQRGWLCHAASGMNRRRPRVTLREAPRLNRFFSPSPDSMTEAFASRFESDRPGVPLPIAILHPATTLSAFGAVPLLEVGDGLADLRFRHDAGESLTYPLRLVTTFRKLFPPHIAQRVPPDLPSKKRYRRWPPPAETDDR